MLAAKIAGDAPLANGGPVEWQRGFILHSSDFSTDPSDAIDRGASPRDAHALAAAAIEETWLASAEVRQIRAQEDERHVRASSDGA